MSCLDLKVQPAARKKSYHSRDEHLQGERAWKNDKFSRQAHKNRRILIYVLGNEDADDW